MKPATTVLLLLGSAIVLVMLSKPKKVLKNNLATSLLQIGIVMLGVGLYLLNIKPALLVCLASLIGIKIINHRMSN